MCIRVPHSRVFCDKWDLVDALLPKFPVGLVTNTSLNLFLSAQGNADLTEQGNCGRHNPHFSQKTQEMGAPLSPIFYYAESALGNLVWKSRMPTHSGVTAMRTMEGVVPRS